MKYPVVYIYKKTSDKGRELRESIKTLANITNWNGQIYVIGHKEAWLTDAIVIDAPKFATRNEDVQSKYRTIATHKKTPNDFILMNDDFFITRPTEVKPLHQGNLPDQPSKSNWYATKNRTRLYLEELGIKNPKDYDIHVPMIMNKQKLAEIIDINKGRNERNFLMTRSLYGNIHKTGGRLYKDQKTRTGKLPDAPFVSSHMYFDGLGSIGVPAPTLPIPKIIHQVWIGPLPRPNKWMDTWKYHNPDWEYILWDNDKVFSRKWKNQHLIDEYVRRYEEEVKGGVDTFMSGRGAVFKGEKATLFAWHVIADLLRYEILYEYGGYMPGADTACLKSINGKFAGKDFGTYTVRTGNLYVDRYNDMKAIIKKSGRRPTKQEQYRLNRYAYENASPLLASKKGNHFTKTLIAELNKLKPKDLGEAVDTTGNVFMGKMIRKHKPQDLHMIDYVIRGDRLKVDDYSIHYSGTTRGSYQAGRK